MTNHCELARVRCGGWRRQYTSLLTSPTAFTFVYYRDRKIHIQRRHPPSDKAIPSGESGRQASNHSEDHSILHEINKYSAVGFSPTLCSLLHTSMCQSQSPAHMGVTCTVLVCEELLLLIQERAGMVVHSLASDP